MALTLKVPRTLERQLTETKWDVAEETLRRHPERSQETVLTTPTHVYSVERAPDGTLERTRTKSQEEPNVDLVASPRTGGVLSLLVGDPS